MARKKATKRKYTRRQPVQPKFSREAFLAALKTALGYGIVLPVTFREEWGEDYNTNSVSVRIFTMSDLDATRSVFKQFGLEPMVATEDEYDIVLRARLPEK